MMKKIVMAVVAIVILACGANAFADVQKFRFGILKMQPDGSYEMDVETKRIPWHLKKSGFRFGIAFDNPGNKYIEWYEVVQFPNAVKQISGDFQKTGKNILKGDIQAASDSHVVDQFWFDEGDPLGMHRLKVYVNGAMKFQVDFEVVEPGNLR
jgi:hypothetical protein